MMSHGVPESHLIQLGDMMVSFAMLESQLQSLTGSLILEHQRVGQIITAELSFSSLRALLISLYLERHGEDEDYQKIREYVKQAGLVEAKRNQITHSIWAAGKDRDHISRIKRTAKEKHGIKFQFEDVSVQALQTFVSEIKELAGTLVQLQFDLIKRGKIVNNPLAKIW